MSGWGSLQAILIEARTASQPPDPTCPNDGTLLVDGHCPFDGYRTAAASPSARSGPADWGGLRAALDDP